MRGVVPVWEATNQFCPQHPGNAIHLGRINQGQAEIDSKAPRRDFLLPRALLFPLFAGCLSKCGHPAAVRRKLILIAIRIQLGGARQVGESPGARGLRFRLSKRAIFGQD